MMAALNESMTTCLCLSKSIAFYKTAKIIEIDDTEVFFYLEHMVIVVYFSMQLHDSFDEVIHQVATVSCLPLTTIPLYLEYRPRDLTI